MPFLILLGSLLFMSGLLARMCPLVSVFVSVPLNRSMKLWDISGDGGFWKVQLDVRDLGGHLDLPGGLGLVLFQRGLVRPRLGLLLLVLYLWDFMLSWGWFVVGIFLPISMLPKLLMSLPRL